MYTVPSLPPTYEDALLSLPLSDSIMFFFLSSFSFESVSSEFLTEASQCDSTKNALLGPEFVQPVGQWTSFSL